MTSSMKIETAGDVVAFLEAQHIKRAFADVRAKTGADREQAFVELRQMLAMHESAEELIVHPRARKEIPNGDEVVEARLQEEHNAKAALTALEKMDVDSTEFETAFAELHTDVLAHAEHEETQEFAKPGTELDADELDRMREAGERAEAMEAPTRPHAGAESRLSDAVKADLAVLTEALDEPDADLSLLVEQLGNSCAIAVGSSVGLSITLSVGEVPVSFSVLEDFLDPSEILTSMMFPLSALGHRAAGSQLILYAGTAGAFVGLAADLTYALGAGPTLVQLDQHLTPPDRALGAAGLTTLSRQNQAIGLLLGRGHQPDEALTELHRLARLDAISIDTAAQQLIDSTTAPSPAPH